MKCVLVEEFVFVASACVIHLMMVVNILEKHANVITLTVTGIQEQDFCVEVSC